MSFGVISCLYGIVEAIRDQFTDLSIDLWLWAFGPILMVAGLLALSVD